ncbi:hypothetical protein [Paenarthrobacter sp. NPDC018779]|uniref:hypothetical protein n=1 Tax=Paenarthrobacter sp. NPDC018779 TaxID=3364375 RepID=UPI0037C62C16
MSKLIALAAVALAAGVAADDAWAIARIAGEEMDDETAYRETVRLASDKAYANFGQA